MERLPPREEIHFARELKLEDGKLMGRVVKMIPREDIFNYERDFTDMSKSLLYKPVDFSKSKISDIIKICEKSIDVLDALFPDYYIRDWIEEEGELKEELPEDIECRIQWKPYVYKGEIRHNHRPAAILTYTKPDGEEVPMMMAGYGSLRNIGHVRIKCIGDMNICQERHTDIGSPPREKVLLSVKAEFTLINLIDSIFESVSLMAGTPKATRLYMEHVMKICKERMKAVEEGRSKLYTMEEVRKKLNLKRSKDDETP